MFIHVTCKCIYIYICVYRYILYVCTCDHTRMHVYRYTLHVYTLWTYIHTCNVLHSYRNRPLIDAFLMIFMAFSMSTGSSAPSDLISEFWVSSQLGESEELAISMKYREKPLVIAGKSTWLSQNSKFCVRLPCDSKKNTPFMVNNLPFLNWLV